MHKYLLLLLLPSLLFGNTLQQNKPYEIIATNLQTPWEIAFLPDNSLLVSERPGWLVHIDKNKKLRIKIDETCGTQNRGLLGIALHPDFENNHWLYLYNTVKKNNETTNRVERYRVDKGMLLDKKIIIDDIPGAAFHDGGRIAFGPDGCLYITTGDAGQAELAQDIYSLVGKILRVRDDGSIPKGNPFKNAVYSYGHRSPQGLAWDNYNRLWSTENGPSGFLSSCDELNLIKAGKNYGWPTIKGPETNFRMRSPMLQSGEDIWAPAGAVYWDQSIFFTSLLGEALYEVSINENPMIVKKHFHKEFGRLRTVVLGPDGFFYLTTSNREGCGIPSKDDDKIIKIDPTIFRRGY